MAVDNGSMFDAWWSVLPPLAALWLAFAATPGRADLRIGLVLVVVWVWGIRLTSNWAHDWPGLDHEDWRYLDLYTKGPETAGVARRRPRLSGVDRLPGVAVDGAGAGVGHRPGGVVDGLERPVVGLGEVVLEFVADEQMRRFARTKHPGQVMDRGLWRYSRPPNYFGESSSGSRLVVRPRRRTPPGGGRSSVRWLIAVMFLACVDPVARRAQSGQRRPEFDAYARRTPALVPWPRRRVSPE